MLFTKLNIPQADENLVERPDLFAKLNEGLKRKLTLISANAGFGKTTLVCHWINKFNIPAVWFSIDSNDNDPSDFFQYIIVGIQKLHKDFGLKTLEILKSPSHPSADQIVNMLINEISQLSGNIVLVLDDLHLIINIEISNAIHHLLEYMPPQLHLILLSRSDPSLPLAKLRSQQQLLELRSADLSFSSKDISILFNKKLKSKLTDSDIDALKTKTEGWIAGLQLAALSMQGTENNSGFIDELAGNNRYIMDYLIEEVLNMQSEEVKAFMLQTSILEQLSAPLCNAVLDKVDSQNILEKLDMNNMFVFPLDNERKWYRYHHLFADLLKQRLLTENEAIINELHQKACNWFERNGMFNQAINHALAANNYPKAISLLSSTVEQLWESGHHSAITKYAKIIPEKYFTESPEFCLYYGWILIADGQVNKAKAFIDIAQKRCQQLTNMCESEKLSYCHKLLGKIAVAYAFYFSNIEHSAEIHEHSQSALKYLNNDDPFWYSWAWFANGIANFSEGKLDDSLSAFNKAFDHAKRSGNIYLISTIVLRLTENEQQLGNYKAAYQKCNDLLAYLNEKGYSELTKQDWTFAGIYLTIGISHFMWAEIDKVYENIKLAYQLSQDGNDLYLRSFAMMVYSVVLQMQGKPEGRIIGDQLDALIDNNEAPPFVRSFHLGWKIFVLCQNGQFDEAQELINKAGLDIKNEKNYANETAYSSYANYLLAQNKIDDTELLLSELMNLATAGKRIERIIELKISFAALYKKKGEIDKAVNYIIEAVKLASKEEILSFFVYNIHEIEDLLQQVFKNYKTKSMEIDIPKHYLNRLETVMKQKEKILKIKNDSDLSSRELDTLKQIAENLSNQEIADKLFISINTVKTHVKNILVKLEADNRSLAVEKAIELGLI